jgi:hypothetical protein
MAKFDIYGDAVVQFLESGEFSFFLKWECMGLDLFFLDLDERGRVVMNIWNVFILAYTVNTVITAENSSHLITKDAISGSSIAVNIAPCTTG